MGSARRPSRRSSCESQVTGDAVSLRELTPGTNEEKPRVMKMGKRNIKTQVNPPIITKVANVPGSRGDEHLLGEAAL